MCQNCAPPKKFDLNTPLISFGIIGSGRKRHQVVQLVSYGLNRMVVTAVDV
jgi:hypothetical protein